jgi:hypothetical protein
MTSSGIHPLTFWLVAYRLNQLLYISNLFIFWMGYRGFSKSTEKLLKLQKLCGGPCLSSLFHGSYICLWTSINDSFPSQVYYNLGHQTVVPYWVFAEFCVHLSPPIILPPTTGTWQEHLRSPAFFCQISYDYMPNVCTCSFISQPHVNSEHVELATISKAMLQQTKTWL